MAESLTGSEEDARIQFRILEGTQELSWHLDLTSKGCQVRAERIFRPDFEIITKAETWKQIALGSLSPLRAFIQGKMRVRGNIELGKRFLQRLASSSDKEGE
jgi:putative sterol carrier protein